MSGKRIVTVTDPCEHDEPHDFCSRPRRTLTEGQYVLIEKVDGRWPTWAMQAMGEAEAEAIRTARWSVYLDALSDHTEGTP